MTLKAETIGSCNYEKKVITIGATILVGLSLAACGNSSDSSASSSEKAANKTTSKVKDSTSVPKDANHDWFFKNNIFYAGNETMTLTKSEVRDGAESGTKVLVIYNTILNNSKKRTRSFKLLYGCPRKTKDRHL